MVNGLLIIFRVYESQTNFFVQQIDKLSKFILHYNKFYRDIFWIIVEFFQLLGLLWISPLHLPH